ncbi:MAG: hypothetical protein UW70_C0001G0004 [Candidatus Peregrinibacteria bacterium GW2011_GWA2_44_7]|nr:MAG: hypothetical protein UW70_C0001G0004 [Candidatus Peregrinibacteria bacterium GW2011_GWA2_44_7]
MLLKLTFFLGILLARLWGPGEASSIQYRFSEELKTWKLSESLRLLKEEEPMVSPQPVTILAFGDIMLDRYVRTLMDRNGLDYPFLQFPELKSKMLAQLDDPESKQPPLEALDFLFANLEGPISDTPYVNNGIAMIFNFKPDVIPPLQKYRFNLLSVANNHMFDMGEYGSTQTRQHLADSGIHHFGYSKGVQAFNVNIGDTANGYPDALDYNFNMVSEEQIKMAHAFIDAGADIILGHHSHVIGTSEWYKERPIYYSLGNFVFDQYFQKEVMEGLGLAIELTKSSDPAKPNTIEVHETVFDILKSQPQVRH